MSKTMSKTILLTRSEERNAIFSASRLQGMQLPVVSRPLLQYDEGPFTSVMKQHVFDLDKYDHIIFISQNAVQYGLPHLRVYWPQWPASLRWYAVGPVTASRLIREDIEPIQPVHASTEGLLDLTQLRQLTMNRVLIVRGDGGRELLRETLVHRGAKVDYLEVYLQTSVNYAGAFTDPLGDQVFVLIYSGAALVRLTELIASEFDRFHIVVPSRRLQTMAIELGFDKVGLANNQQDDSMLQVLDQMVMGANPSHFQGL